MLLSEYSKNQNITTSSIANSIIKEYGKELANLIKKGYKFKLLLGAIYIVKKKVLSKKPQILSGATSRLRKATGDNTLVVYRTNEYYYSAYWTMNIVYRILDFKLAKDVFRDLKNHEDDLELNAPLVELEKTSSGRTSSYKIVN